jgi:tRNA(adenine34) deaminase
MSIGEVAGTPNSPAGTVSPPLLKLSEIPHPVHEQAMRLAIATARANPSFPFGAVIVRAADREVIFHGEIVAINDYVARPGNRGWEDAILYSTGEPCPTCMSTLVWARIGGVVYGTSIEKLQQVGSSKYCCRRRQ